MMNEEQLSAEVRAMLESKLARGEIIRVAWLTHEMINQHPDITGTDCDFYRLCAFGHVGRAIKKWVGKYEAAPEQDGQLVLDGFEHLQVGYPVMRDGERLLVPTDQLTDDELAARAAEYERMAAGCLRHAKELRAYIEARQNAA